MNITNFQVPTYVSELYGAAQISHSPFMADFAPANGVVKRGSIVSQDVSGHCVLIAVAADTPYGVLLDDVDTGPTGATDIVAAVVDRKGAFVAKQLITGPATNPGALADKL